MTVVIREAVPGDVAGIFEVHGAAFPTADEARLTVALEADGDVLLSLAADRDGEIVGHVLFSRMDVIADGKKVQAAALAPVAVAPAFQNLGIGSALIDQGLSLLEEQGVAYVFVLGEPDYYDRFGFDLAVGARFTSPYEGDYWMAQILDGRPLPKHGEARHAAAFARLGETS